MQRHYSIDITDRVERFVERERDYYVALEVDALVAALEAQRDTLKAAIGGLLADLPETWGDKIQDGKIELLLDAEAIDAMFKAMQ